MSAKDFIKQARLNALTIRIPPGWEGATNYAFREVYHDSVFLGSIWRVDDPEGHLVSCPPGYWMIQRIEFWHGSPLYIKKSWPTAYEAAKALFKLFRGQPIGEAKEFIKSLNRDWREVLKEYGFKQSGHFWERNWADDIWPRNRVRIWADYSWNNEQNPDEEFDDYAARIRGRNLAKPDFVRMGLGRQAREYDIPPGALSGVLKELIPAMDKAAREQSFGKQLLWSAMDLLPALVKKYGGRGHNFQMESAKDFFRKLPRIRPWKAIAFGRDHIWFENTADKRERFMLYLGWQHHHHVSYYDQSGVRELGQESFTTGGDANEATRTAKRMADLFFSTRSTPA